MINLRSSCLLALMTALSLTATAALSQTPQAPTCRADQLSLSTDGSNGDFNGMSHSGTLVLIRNLSSQACAIQPIAQVTMVDSAGKDLPAKGVLPGARFLHPGPVVLPIVLPAGAIATATLQWVSGPVFDNNACISPSQLRVDFGSAALNAPFSGTLCGDAAKGITFNQTRFAVGVQSTQSVTK